MGTARNSVCGVFYYLPLDWKITCTWIKRPMQWNLFIYRVIIWDKCFSINTLKSKFKIPNCPNRRFTVTPDFYSTSGIEKNFKNNLKWGLLGDMQVLESLPAADYWFSKSPHRSTSFISASHTRLLGYCLSLLWTPCIERIPIFFCGKSQQ